MKRIIVSSVIGLVLATTAFFLSASAARAFIGVYVRFGNGSVVYCPRDVAVGYVRIGGVMFSTLPPGYIAEPYGYFHGYRTYYTPAYWHGHGRYWHNDPAYRHSGHGYGHYYGGGHNDRGWDHHDHH